MIGWVGILAICPVLLLLGVVASSARPEPMAGPTTTVTVAACLPFAARWWPTSGGRFALISLRDGNMEIYAMNADGSGLTRLTYNAGWDTVPAWSPDNTRIAFNTYRNANNEVYVINADGSDQTNLTNHPGADWGPAGWAP